MEKYSEVIGLPVICIENGKKLGVIEDMIFCPKLKQIQALLLERKGYQIRKKVLLMKDIHRMGKDAVVVKDCTCLTDMKKAEAEKEIKDKGNVLGLRIYTKTGEDIGVVKDVLFDYQTGTIEGVELSDGLFQDIIQGRNILPLFGKVEFGEENILVDREAVEEILTNGGGLRKKLLGTD